MSRANFDPAQSITLSAGEIKYYRDEGFLLIPGLIAAETAYALRDEVMHVFEQHGTTYDRLCRALNPGDKLRQSGEYLAGGLLDGFVNSPAMLSIATQLLGGMSSLYMPFSAVKNGGGGGRFHFHQDNQYTRFTDGLLGINLWTALIDMSPENGCLEVVPRSHLRGTLDAVPSGDGDVHRRVPTDPQDFLPLRMRAGDCVAFSRLTVHGSGPNRTGAPRFAYALQYHRDDAQAIWDNQPPRRLKGANRWPIGPVERISQRFDERSRDGH
jgi:2-oxoglutarate-dependent dioxygenase